MFGLYLDGAMQRGPDAGVLLRLSTDNEDEADRYNRQKKLVFGLVEKKLRFSDKLKDFKIDVLCNVAGSTTKIDWVSLLVSLTLVCFVSFGWRWLRLTAVVMVVLWVLPLRGGNGGGGRYVLLFGVIREAVMARPPPRQARFIAVPGRSSLSLIGPFTSQF